MFAMLCAHAPELVPLVRFMYQANTPLHVSTVTTLRSEIGVQQGDPLSSMLFALTLHALVNHIRKQTELDLNLWFWDD
jgi:hypothetical protein